MVHELKTWPEYFQEVVKGNKTFEIRKNDRNYQVGDILHLKEYDPVGNQYTGSDAVARVTYVLDKQPFVPFDYVCMGIMVKSITI